MIETHIAQNPLWSCFEATKQTAFASAESGESILFCDAKAGLAFDIWNLTYEPMPERALVEQLSSESVGKRIVADMLSTLADEAILIRGKLDQLTGFGDYTDRNALPCRRLLVGLTGAVQSASFIPFLKLLRRHFCKELKVVLTQAASKFVTPEALSYQLDCEVYSDASADPNDLAGAEHIMLSQWPECVLVAPATASSIWRIANSTCSDLLSQTITALDSRVPVVIGPSMNERMWLNTGVQNNIQLCRDRGYWIIQPGVGVEVSAEWENRKPMIGVLGPQPHGLLSIMKALYQVRTRMS